MFDVNLIVSIKHCYRLITCCVLNKCEISSNSHKGNRKYKAPSDDRIFIEVIKKGMTTGGANIKYKSVTHL